jgi:hypothetical protein
MYSRTKSERRQNAVFTMVWPHIFDARFLSVLARALFIFTFVVSYTQVLRAQQNGAAIGRVEGNDISVEGAGAPGNGGAPSAGGQLASFLVSNGNVVTVHVGQARMTLAAGGQVDICGPAKFTVLESGGAITLALNFGRMHVQIPATTSLRIYTPTIIAAPLDIGGAVRDINVGLDLNDSLCVVSTGGAVRLEQQFSGEGLIVPQAGEFFLEGGNLVPVVGAPGSCECLAQLARETPPPPETAPDRFEPSRPEIAQNVPLVPSAPPVVSQAQPPVAPMNVAVAEPEAPRYRVEIGELGRANEMHPVAPTTNFAAPSAPPELTVQYTVIVQPLVVSVTPSPLRPAEPAADTALLVRVARVEPEYEFTGHVAAPEFAADMRRALGQTPVVRQPQPLQANQPAKKKRGFWGALKSIFVGSDETRK